MSIAEARGSQLPEGVTGLYGDKGEYKFRRRRPNAGRRHGREFPWRGNDRRHRQSARPFEGGPFDERPQRRDHSRSRRSRRGRVHGDRRKQGLGRRFGRSEHGCIGERKMKFRGALKLLRFFLSTQAARNVTKRSVFGIGRGRSGAGALGDGRPIDRARRLLPPGGRRRGLVFARFQLGAIFWYKDLTALQVFGRVNMFVFFPPGLFAGAFLTSCFGNTFLLSLDLVLSLVLRLSVANSSARKGK